MKLMTKAVEHSLPKLYSTDNNPDPIVRVKFFNPTGAGTWYATEGSPTEDGDFRFFGYVEIQTGEWGYFLLSELTSYRGRYGIGIERDLHCPPAPISRICPRAGARSVA